jgi:hypothetical protein
MKKNFFDIKFNFKNNDINLINFLKKNFIHKKLENNIPIISSGAFFSCIYDKSI